MSEKHPCGHPTTLRALVVLDSVRGRVYGAVRWPGDMEWIPEQAHRWHEEIAARHPDVHPSLASSQCVVLIDLEEAGG
jgi:hypothetical protein